MSEGLEAHLIVERRSGFRLDVDFSIARGETAALLGPNGAGKSTAVSVIAGLMPLDDGCLRLDGETLDDPGNGLFVTAEDRRVGVVFQEYILFPHLTVLENVAFGLRSRRVKGADALSAAREWVTRLGLVGLESKRPGGLSGGQAQRVALARALITRPELLLLDEPLSALDVTTRTTLRRSLSEHLEEFTGPKLLITHDPTEAFLLADTVHVVESGTITQSGEPDDIRLRPRTRYAADLAGSNLVMGTATDGVVRSGEFVIHIADHEIEGPVLLTIHPTAVAVHRGRPEGSPRNSWATVVEVVEHLGDRVRLRTGSPLPLTVEVTGESSRALRLRAQTAIWLSVKATEIGVEPQA